MQLLGMIWNAFWEIFIEGLIVLKWGLLVTALCAIATGLGKKPNTTSQLITKLLLWGVISGGISLLTNPDNETVSNWAKLTNLFLSPAIATAAIHSVLLLTLKNGKDEKTQESSAEDNLALQRMASPKGMKCFYFLFFIIAFMRYCFAK